MREGTLDPAAVPAPVAAVKKQFFAMRNGIVADTLRKAGVPHNTIFGLQLPQLSEIAKSIGKDATLGLRLWEDSEVRESRLLACWLIPHDALTREEIVSMGEALRTREEADILAFRMLRYRPDWVQLCETFERSHRPMTQYLAEALRRNMGA